MIPPVRRHQGHSYARHGGCRRRRRDRRDRVRYLIPLRASRFRGVGSVEAGPAANNPGPRAVLRQHAPSATRQRTLEANGIDCGASVLGVAAYAASGTARAGRAVQSPREGTSIGVAAPASVLQVSVRGRLVACAFVPPSVPVNHRCASPSRVRAALDCRVGGALLPACRPRRAPFLSEP